MRVVNNRRVCTARVTVLSLYVCTCMCYLANSYTGYTKANAVLKVFDLWILLKILCSKVTALFAHHNELGRFRQPVDSLGGLLMSTGDYWRLLVVRCCF